MHRCLYSIIHQDDMIDLKMVLETVFPTLVSQMDSENGERLRNNTTNCSLGVGDMCKPLSFILRMRCFSGSSVGYLVRKQSII